MNICCKIADNVTNLCFTLESRVWRLSQAWLNPTTRWIRSLKLVTQSFNATSHFPSNFAHSNVLISLREKRFRVKQKISQSLIRHYYLCMAHVGMEYSFIPSVLLRYWNEIDTPHVLINFRLFCGTHIARLNHFGR